MGRCWTDEHFPHCRSDFILSYASLLRLRREFRCVMMVVGGAGGWFRGLQSSIRHRCPQQKVTTKSLRYSISPAIHTRNSFHRCSFSSSTLSPSSSPTPFHRPRPKSWQSAALENIFFCMTNAPGRIHQKSNRFPSTASFEWAPYRNRVGTIKKNIHSSTIEAVTNQQC